MKIVDLSQKNEPGMTQFPGTPDMDIKQIAQIDEGGFRVTDFHAVVHVGTHCDAPAHVVKGAKTIDEIPLDCFVGDAVIIDVCVKENKEIKVNSLKGYDIRPGDIVIFRTGYSKYWNKPEYVDASPYLSEETAKELVRLKVKSVGMDFLSPDPVDSTTSPAHKTLLGNGVLIIENLNNLEEIDVPRVFFAAAPLLIDKSDGAFTRAFAVIK